MKTLLIVIGVIAFNWLMVMIMSGICSIYEQKDDPCETCLRWSECNGVDDKCPWRDTDGAL